MPDVPPDVEAAIAAMSDSEFSVFTAKVRAPDGAAAIRDFATRAGLTAAEVESRTYGLNPAAFVVDGKLDQARLARTLGVTVTGQAPDWSRGGTGQAGRAAARKRFGEPGDEQQQRNPPHVGNPGDAGRAVAAKRFGTLGTASHHQDQRNSR